MESTQGCLVYIFRISYNSVTIKKEKREENEGEIETFLDIYKLREFRSSRSTLQEMKKKVLQSKRKWYSHGNRNLNKGKQSDRNCTYMNTLKIIFS